MLCFFFSLTFQQTRYISLIGQSFKHYTEYSHFATKFNQTKPIWPAARTAPAGLSNVYKTSDSRGWRGMTTSHPWSNWLPHAVDLTLYLSDDNVEATATSPCKGRWRIQRHDTMNTRWQGGNISRWRVIMGHTKRAVTFGGQKGGAGVSHVKFQHKGITSWYCQWPGVASLHSDAATPLEMVTHI